MSKLSWVLYGIDLLDSASSWFTFIAFCGGCICAAGIGACVYGFLEGEIKLMPFGKRLALLYGLPIFFLGSIVASLLPSKNTALMIVASEIGAQNGQLPEIADKSMKVLNKFLDAQLRKKDD